MATPSSHYALVTSVGDLLDQVQIGRGFLDFVDALIIVAVTQANVEPVLRDPALHRAYATYDAPPPDALRRPISINALAQSLGLPFETVRRRVTRLTLAGPLRMAPGGVWTPTNKLVDLLHRRTADGAYRRTLGLYAKLRHLDRLAGLPHGEPWSGAPPLRAASRVSGAYFLRLVHQLTELFGDTLSAAIWLEILRSSTRPVQGPCGLSLVAGEGASRAQIAKRLSVPSETVRRRVAALAAQGACELRLGRLVVAPEILERPAYARLADRNLDDLRRMFAGLAQLGILQPAHAQTVAA